MVQRKRDLFGLFNRDTGAVEAIAPSWGATPYPLPAVQPTTAQVTALQQAVAAGGGVIGNAGLHLLRQGIARAAAGNPLDLAPWKADTAYQANETVVAGAVRNAGGNRYVAKQGGTCGAASAPAATTYAPIADNTVVWEYAGKAATADLTGAPTVTVDNTDRTATFSKSYGLALSGAFATKLSDGYFNVSGGEPTAGPAGSVKLWSATTSDISTGRAGRINAGFEFCVNGDDVVLELHTSNTEGLHRLTVDGRFVNLGMQPGAASLRTTILIVFGDSRPFHTVKVEGGQNLAFRCVRVRPAQAVWAPPKQGPRIWALGNSYFAGGDGWPTNTGIPNVAGMLLGAHQLINAATGGNGLDNPGATRVHHLRLDEASRFAPDVILYQASYFTSTTEAAYKASMLTFLQTLRGYANLAAVPVFIVGQFPSSTGPSAETINMDNGAAAACTEFADPLVFYMRQATATPEPWIFGTGRATATNGTGPADLYISGDGAHHNNAGTVWYGRRIAQEIARVMAGVRA